MKAISLWQPWATWIALGWKTIETRTHKRFASLVGERIAIHACMKWDKTAIEKAEPYLENIDPWAGVATQFCKANVLGAVVCTAKVVQHSALDPSSAQAALIECRSIQRYGLFLEDIEKLKVPMPAKGAQGIWNVELLPPPNTHHCPKCGKVIPTMEDVADHAGCFGIGAGLREKGSTE